MLTHHIAGFFVVGAQEHHAVASHGQSEAHLGGLLPDHLGVMAGFVDVVVALSFVVDKVLLFAIPEGGSMDGSAAVVAWIPGQVFAVFAVGAMVQLTARGGRQEVTLHLRVIGRAAFRQERRPSESR